MTTATLDREDTPASFDTLAVITALERIERAITRGPAEEEFRQFVSAPSSVTLGDVLAAVNRIERLLAARQAAALDKERAAAYLGVDLAAFDRLVAAHDALRPVCPCDGVALWRRDDLYAFLASLER